MERGLGITSIESGSVDDALARSGVYVIRFLVFFFEACFTGAGGERYIH